MDAATDAQQTETIEDRIAAAMRKRRDVNHPDPEAPTEVPDGETELGYATSNIKHLLVLRFELGQKHQQLVATFEQAEGPKANVKALDDLRQNKSDVQAVETKLSQLLDAEFRGDKGPMRYTILTDWRVTGAEMEEPEMPEFIKALLGGLGLPDGVEVEFGGDIPDELKALMDDADMQMIDAGNGVMIGVGVGRKGDDGGESAGPRGIGGLLEKLRRRTNPGGNASHSRLGQALGGAIMRSLQASGSDGESALKTIERTVARMEAEDVPMDAEFDIRIKARTRTQPSSATEAESTDGDTELNVELAISVSAEPAESVAEDSADDASSSAKSKD